jgi:cbb3-type cytochrome oxidase subunit 3
MEYPGDIIYLLWYVGLDVVAVILFMVILLAVWYLLRSKKKTNKEST